MLNTSGGETWLGTNRGLFKLATSGDPLIWEGRLGFVGRSRRLEGRPMR